MSEAQYERFLGLTRIERSAMVTRMRKGEVASDELQLSRAQRGMWFLQQAAPFDPSFNITEAWRMSGPLRLDALNSAIGRIAERHESLRSRFANVDGIPVRLVSTQQIRADIATHLDPWPLRELPEKVVRGLAEEEAARPFNLEAEPLFRCRVVVLGPHDHLLLVTMHHIISDSTSFRIFYRELRQFYWAYLCGADAEAAELRTQYIDSVSRERVLLDSEWREREIAFWRRELSNVKGVLDLPSDFPRLAPRNFSDSFVEEPVPASLMTSLGRLAGREKVAPSMILLAAYAVLLYRYTGEDDLLIGVPVAGRSPGERDLIGLFVNTVVVRIHLSGDPAFTELLYRVRDAAVRARKHAKLPFDLLVERLKPARVPGRNPLFQVFFSHENAWGMEPLGDAHITKIEMHYPIPANFDLALSIVDGHDGISRVMLRYSSSLFERSTIERILTDYLNVLVEVAERPANRISAVGHEISCQARLENLAPAAIEEAILRVPGIEGAAVISSEDNGDLVAFYVSPTGLELSTLRAEIGRALPGCVLPRVFVPLAYMPVTASGEPDRAALPVPRLARSTSRSAGTPTEIAIAAIWRDVLGCGSVGALDDFFEIGGHSALAIQIVHRVEQELDVRLPVSAIFEAPTVETLAELVDTALWLNAGGADTSGPAGEHEMDVL